MLHQRRDAHKHFLGEVPDKRWHVPFVFLSITWAISIHTVTAFLYCGRDGRPFWNTALLAPRLLTSAFVAGPAFIIVVLQLIHRMTQMKIGEGSIRTLAGIMRITIPINLCGRPAYLHPPFKSCDSRVHRASRGEENTQLMFGYGKMSGCAVAAMSALAENHSSGGKLNSQQIAESRNLSQPLVAKVLTVLSQGGFVIGTRGPGGGYCLARPPSKISVYDVVELFEGHRDPSACPFGPGWCGVGDPCPLHDTLFGLADTAADRLKKKTFAIFTKKR